jgi:hypothetical protein
MSTQENFEETKRKAEELYKSFGEVYCPYFKSTISFDARGLEHLKFKRRGKSRLEQDQFMRLKFIHLAPEILKLSHTLQGKLETTKFEHVKTNNRWEHSLKKVTYFEFIALIKRERCKIIIKQVGQDKLFFWSIIPYWEMNQSTMTRVFHNGEPEED